ncbi:MAG: hypothetical protein AAFN51_10835 [Pseudomonadota bacterium]
MSIVSEVFFSSVISPQSKSSGKDSTVGDARARASGGVGEAPAVRLDPTVQRIVEQTGGASRSNADGSARVFPSNLVPGNGKYSRFVDAVQALRLDEAAAAELTQARVAELKAAAAEVFQIRKDIPREKRPIEMLEEQHERQVERDQHQEFIRGKPDVKDQLTATRPLQEQTVTGKSPEVETSLPGAEAISQTASIPEPVVTPDLPETGAVSDVPSTANTNSPAAQPAPAVPTGSGVSQARPEPVE